MQMHLGGIPLPALHFLHLQVRGLLADQFAQFGYAVVARVKGRFAAVLEKGPGSI